MSADDMKTFARLIAAVDVLPDSRKEWLLGYVDGMADAKQQLADDQKHQQHQEQTE